MEVTVSNLRQARSKATSQQATHVVSLVDVGFPRHHQAIHFRNRETLLLHFDDTDNANDPRGPKLEHAKKMLHFFHRAQETNGSLLIHCHAGVSRSTASALAALFLDIGDVAEAGKRLLTIRPQACPNELLLNHFDKLLNLNGKFAAVGNKIAIDWINRM